MAKPLTPAQRDARNARRRAKRLADIRHRMARHAARKIFTGGDWTADNPITPQQVIDMADALYGNHREIKDVPITAEEATAALDEVLPKRRSSIPAA
ncbi:hypothetical protein GCM10010406_21360 [Streptomyces thermolineatus]|uniref:Uncharacterized protein n=1 Tax=Streptomyces thermolineatus TaxID=44033 RepID=A0ABN3LIE2_9ACTN